MLLIDTDVFSYRFKNDSRIEPYLPLLESHPLAVSIITIAELFRWATVHQWGTKRVQRLENILDDYVMLPLNKTLCYQWATIQADCQAKGYVIHDHDCWLAATAIYHDIPLVTHNPKDFRCVAELMVLNY